ncbi:hypothetical protein ABZZ17_04225 [Streptomyces sp. NPDC006512]|uniref:hypothetical protein n=1 Tax=Streptomyces sp. NPDC006512 TaxID=3154307 RepID=UPI0033A6B5E8
MPQNDQIPPGGNAPDDDRWNALLSEVSAGGAAPHEPVAPARKRLGAGAAALGLAVAGLAFLALRFVGSPSGEDGRDTGKPAAAPAAPAAVPTHEAAGRPMIPLADAFPAEVPDGAGGTYTKVGAATLGSCPEPGAMGPRLAGLIEASAGCVGEQVALYKDARDNQFNLALFTMKDPQDTVTLVFELSRAFDDYQVAAQGPPPGSGLPTLPADSGMVQSFAGDGRVMVVGMGQWSDGRTADYQQLVDRLKPLQDAVAANVGRHEAR